MGWFQIFNMKIIYALAEYLGLMVGFNRKT